MISDIRNKIVAKMCFGCIVCIIMALPAGSDSAGEGHSASDGLRFVVHIPETVSLKITPTTDARRNHSVIDPSGLPVILPSGYPAVDVEALGYLHAGRTVSLTAEKRHTRPGLSVTAAPREDRATLIRTTADAGPLSFAYRRTHPASPVYDIPVVYTLSAP